MDAPPSLHPTDQTLSSYGLGKLDDGPAEAVNQHLEQCSACRKRVAEMSSDSFLGRVRDAQKGSGTLTPNQSQGGGTSNHKSANNPAPPRADTLPPGLADHPDYEIKKELGRGGMGVVYLAHNTLMGRDEVLKVMGRQIMERPGVLDRFLREIRAVAKLRHANIVTAHHATRLGESIVFAMEYVDGLDLSKLVKAKGPLPVSHACNFVYQAALGLQHAHEEGLVHRDIKPANLMLARKGDKGTVKVLDFGLAKIAREEKVDCGLTSEGQALGTPDYIAPEQILDAQGADIRADIYSLGGTLYYLLTGRPPFRATSLYDLYQAHISRDADPLNLVRPEVPSELAALVAKMMAKDPARRIQTPGEVARALTPFFKKGSLAFKDPQADVSQFGPLNPARPTPEEVSTPTQPATDAGGPAVPVGKTVTPTVTESRWDSLIDVKETESSVDATPAADPVRRPPWGWPAVAVGVLTFGLLAAGLSGVFKVKTLDGVIVLENVPKDAEVLVDGNKVTFSWPGGGGPVEVRAVPGRRKVEVKKDGFKTFGEMVTVEAERSEEVTVRLEALEDNSGFVPLFNGKDLSGWTDVNPGSETVWTVHDGVIQGRARNYGSSIATVRSNYGDFHIRMEIYQIDYGTQLYFRATSTPGDIKHYEFNTGVVMGDGQIIPLGTCTIKAGGGLRQFRTQEGLNEITSPEMLPLVKNKWHIVEIIAVGNVFRMQVDGKEVSAFSDTRSRLKEGMISIFMWKGTNINIRKIEIKELNATHPSTTIDSVVPDPPESTGGVPVDGDGFHPLFNGRDKEHWVETSDNKGEWKVVNGILEGRGSETGRATLVTTRDDFSDFRLRATIFNDGQGKVLYFRRTSKGLTHNGYGILVGGASTADGRRIPLGSITKAQDSAQYGTQTIWNVAAETVPVALNDWYTFEITAIGKRITSSINGKKVAEFTDGSQSSFTGRILLNSRPRTTIRFKDILIQDLATAAGTRGLVANPDEAEKHLMGKLTVPPAATSGAEPKSPPAAPTRVPPDGPARRALWVFGEGEWTVEGEQLIKEGIGFGGVAFGDRNWLDYDLSFEVRKSAGPDGLGAAFRFSKGHHYGFNLGGEFNTRHDFLRETKEKPSVVQSIPGTIRPLDWYKVKISLRGQRIRIDLNDHLLLECSDTFSQQGHVELRFLNSAGGFRNIKITAPDGTVLWEGPPDLPKNDKSVGQDSSKNGLAKVTKSPAPPAVNQPHQGYRRIYTRTFVPRTVPSKK